MSIFVIDSEKTSNNKTIYLNSFNENIKLKPEYQFELAKLVRYDKNLQDEQFYISRYDKIYYYSKYPDNYIKCNIDSELLETLNYQYPGYEDFGVDFSRIQYEVSYNG